MVAITAIVRPTESVQVLHLLEQCLRRHFASVPGLSDALVIHMPDVGHVVVTEQVTSMRLGFVADDATAASAAMKRLEEQVQAQVKNQGLIVSWDVPAEIQPALQE